jgi:hypothetical protein
MRKKNICLALLLLCVSALNVLTIASSSAADSVSHRASHEAGRESEERKREIGRDESSATRSHDIWHNTDLTNRKDTRSLDISALDAKLNARARENAALVYNVNNHAFAEHAQEYGVKTQAEFKKIAEEHLERPDDKVDLYKGEATAYWSDKHQSILIQNHLKPESSTMFKPDRGKQYYLELKQKYGPKNG